MKRTVSLLLVLMLTAALLAGCSEKEPVAFTTDLRPGSPAFVDVVSIEPVYRMGETQFSYDYTACRCITTDGETMWIYMEAAQYNQYLNHINFKALEWQAGKTTFAQPLRFHGTVKTSDGTFDGLERRTKTDTLLVLESVDAAEADAAMGRNLTETEFSSNTVSLAPVYADITAIMPAYEITGGLGSKVNAFVCEALGTDGSTLWIYVDYLQYTARFDGSLLTTGPTGSYNPVYFETPVRIHGTARCPDDLYSSAEDDEISMLILFESRD